MQELPPLDHASVRALSLSDGVSLFHQFHPTNQVREPSQINSDQPDEATIFDGALLEAITIRNAHAQAVEPAWMPTII